MRTSERHQLKQDKFAVTTKEYVSWAVEHRNKLITGLLLAAIVVAVVLGGTWVWTSRNERANLELGKAMNTYSAPLRPPNTPADPEVISFTSAQERARVSHAEFQKIADQYGYTKAGQVARYMAATTLVNMGDTQAGEQEMQRITHSRDKDLAALAKLSLAGLYRDNNRPKDALALYQDLIAHPTASVSKSEAQLELAELYEKTNQDAEAGKLYSEILRADPRSFAASIAQQHLSTMR